MWERYIHIRVNISLFEIKYNSERNIPSSPPLSVRNSVYYYH